MHGTTIGLAIHILIEFAVIMRVLLRPHREPASRIAWIAVVAALPAVGILAYLLFGEVNIGRRRIARMRKVLDELPPVASAVAGDESRLKADVPERYQHLFRVGHSISGFAPVGGSTATLLPDSNATIDSMVADIDAAQEHVHLLFYIWLADNNGCKIVEALKRAAARGVKCRAMADGLGSRAMIRSNHWRDMRDAGVHVAVALPIGNPLLRPLVGRIDLRNHRKILVIDGHITYCGSQNCADPEFLVKAKYAPWVDAVMRFEGPIARQNQHLFIGDWMTYVEEDLSDLLRCPIPAPQAGAPAQVIGTGPTVRYSAMPEMFESLMHAARRELVISTPYYVPDESMQNALCATAYRGVDTKMVNDESLRRFEREVQTASGLTHPNTIDIFDFGRTPEGSFYCAMEFLSGRTLEDVVRSEGPLAADRAVDILRQIAGSLNEAHHRGLVHRDIKPSNIMLCEQGGIPDFVKVLDFGLARALERRDGEDDTRPGVVLGTPTYLAPERITDPATVDPRSDLYSFGAVGYFLLTGRHLYDATRAGEFVYQILHETPRRPSDVTTREIPRELEEFIMLCLARSPQDRPATMQEVMTSISQHTSTPPSIG